MLPLCNSLCKCSRSTTAEHSPGIQSLIVEVKCPDVDVTSTIYICSPGFLSGQISLVVVVWDKDK